MVSFPSCKINLGLHVVRKREDGFHDISTCFYPVPWTDILEIIPSDVFGFQSSGALIPDDLKGNLCVRAYDLLKKDFNIPPVSIHLHKIIPTGAGLGGGSSDAAFTLRILNGIFKLSLSNEQMKKYASMLGSDCAFFVEEIPMIGKGRGELLTPIQLDLSGKFLVLVKPDIHVSTAQAYSGVIPAVPEEAIENILQLPVKDWKGKLVNDFEKSVFEKFPAIARVKDQLYKLGAEYASMSGSGSTVFGIFSSDVPGIANHFPEHQCWSGSL